MPFHLTNRQNKIQKEKKLSVKNHESIAPFPPSAANAWQSTHGNQGGDVRTGHVYVIRIVDTQKQRREVRHKTKKEQTKTYSIRKRTVRHELNKTFRS